MNNQDTLKIKSICSLKNARVEFFSDFFRVWTREPVYVGGILGAKQTDYKNQEVELAIKNLEV